VNQKKPQKPHSSAKPTETQTDEDTFTAFGGGMPKMPSGVNQDFVKNIMGDPEIQKLLQDPTVLPKLMEIMQNPAALSKYMDDPKIMSVVQKIQNMQM